MVAPTHPMVVRLLKRDMPRMQPSALKHEFLTSVANVLRNPVAGRRQDDGATRIIGFADISRTLPLTLIVEPEPDSTVRHAFVPSPRDELDAQLLADLQVHEDQWATKRGAQPRNIAAQIRHRGRGEVNRHGINHYEGGPPFTKADLDQIAVGRWYPTAPLPARHEIDHPGRPDLHVGLDGIRIAANLSASATMASGQRDGTRLRVELDQTARRELKLHRLITEEPLPTPEPDDQYE